MATTSQQNTIPLASVGIDIGKDARRVNSRGLRAPATIEDWLPGSYEPGRFCFVSQIVLFHLIYIWMHLVSS